MSKFLFVLFSLTGCAAIAFAQQDPGEADLLKKLDAINSTAGLSPSSTPAPSPDKKSTSDQQQGPTEITATKEATYDEKTRMAVFTGDVHVNDPQFKITCDKLTAFLREQATSSHAAASPAASPTPKPKASPAASPRGGGSTGTGSGLKSAIAEGHVVIIQDKPAANGEAAQHNVGKCQRAEYNADTGDVTLIGWPQVQQGINMQVATEEGTVMIMNKDG